MAMSMDYCPGGAEFDEDDEFDDGFMFGHDEINGFERSEFNVSVIMLMQRMKMLGNATEFPRYRYIFSKHKRVIAEVYTVTHNLSLLHMFQNGNSNHYEDRGGFGTPSLNSKSPKTKSVALERKMKEATTVGADDFRMAILRGNLDAIKTFINKGYKVNTVLKCGWTPLMYAASSALPQIVKFLIDNGADPHSHKDMYTVLMAACGSVASSEEDILQCVSYLLEKGVNVNAHDRYHMSPLMYACREGRVKVISKLLDNQANINKQDSRGWTSLSWAVSKNHQGAVKLLVERGADIKKVHCDGQTALDIAIAQDLQAIIKLLGGDTSNNSTSSLSYSNSAFPITNGWTQPPNSSIPEVSGPSKKAMIYGELELFLTGLGLNHLVQLFQEQQVDFDMFLRMTDEDFIKMGIQQIGVRKKILYGIHMVHKREWEKESLPTVKYNKKMSCVEAVAIAANISKHIKYLGSTIHYIADQVTGNSSVLEIQDGATPKQLQKHCEETLANVELLQKELDRLSSRLQKVFQKRNVDPPDLVTSPKRRKSRVNYKRVLVASAVCVPVGVALYYNKDNVINHFHRIFSFT